MILRGGCHCGALTVELETAREPAALPLRECQCRFCRMHAARNTVDREGRARIVVDDAVLRYRFSLGTADFLVCGRCGIYVACVLDDAFASINTRVLDAAFPQPPQPVDYAGETAEARRARRRATWTPASITRAWS
jgi:hypothetical protein